LYPIPLYHDWYKILVCDIILSKREESQPMAGKNLKIIVFVFIFISAVSLISNLLVWSSPSGVSSITVMSYNVQNLFDDIDNGTEYREFDPGRGKWNTMLFHEKLKAIARVIRESIRGGPDIVALQEVENRNVLLTLSRDYLSDMGYRYIAIVPKKGLAANVGILSRFPILRVHSYYVSNYESNPLRNILEAEIDIKGNILHLFNNHWKSKSGGKAYSEKWRLEAACILKERLEDLLSGNREAEVMVLGDLNEDYNEYLEVGKSYQTALIPIDAAAPETFERYRIFLTGFKGRAGLHGERLILYEPWYELVTGVESGEKAGRAGVGSYVFRKRWETPDHILLSEGLLDHHGLGYEKGNFRVVKKDFMLYGESGYPMRWSTLYRSGFSDHLPLLITIRVYGRN